MLGTLKDYMKRVTRMILHCVKTKTSSIVVSARHTDILITYIHLMASNKIWMKAETAKKRNFIPVLAIVKYLQMISGALEILPGLRDLRGSDIDNTIIH
jgi:hypothetical protein